ncbi:MAG: hypothetical protein II969_04705 [Anaerolineaceae bacterium]|nr:hypothetical protein [Anaerolineaceae bacterium]
MERKIPRDYTAENCSTCISKFEWTHNCAGFLCRLRGSKKADQVCCAAK